MTDSPRPAAIWASVDSLRPWVKNPRKNEAAVDAAAASIKAHGWGAPILARAANSEVIAGHTRLKAAIRLGLKEVPVRFLDVSEEQAHALALADNKVGESSAWDEQTLAQVLKDLGDSAATTGFSTDEIEALIGKLDAERLEGAADDEPPPVPDTPVSVAGEVYVLGPHRLVCGDAANADVYTRLLPDQERADILVTDPPYGVNLGAKNRNLNKLKRKMGYPGGMIEKDIADDEVAPTQLWTDVLSLARAHLKAGSSYYVTGPQGADLALLMVSLSSAGLPLRHMLVWSKSKMVLGRADYHYQHEPILYGWVEGTHRWYGDRSQTSVWAIDRPDKSKLHPTTKPPEIYRRALRNSAKPGDIILDPFAGSGTALVAAALEGNKARLVELDPGYCDVIRKRWGALARKGGLDVGDGL